MRYFELEITKLLHRRQAVLLLCFYIISLPALINILTSFTRTGAEGTYVDDVAMAYFSFTLTYIFLPLWVVVLNGMEFRNGHVHRVVFLTSRNSYFVAKIVFCIITGVAFAIIGLITLAIADVYSPYTLLIIPLMFYVKFFIQCFLTFLLYALFLTALGFLVRNVVATYLIYIFWLFFENLIFKIGEKSGEKLIYLPLHLLNGLFAKEGTTGLGNYFMVFDQWKNAYVGVVLMIVVMLWAAHRYFTKTNLFSLSD